MVPIDEEGVVKHAGLVLFEGGVTHGSTIGHLGSGKLPSEGVRTARNGKERRYRACRRRASSLSRISEGGVVCTNCEEPGSRTCREDLGLSAWGVALLTVLRFSVPPLVAPYSEARPLTLCPFVSS